MDFHHFKGLFSKSSQEKETKCFSTLYNDIANVQGDRNSKIQARIRYGWQLWQKEWAQRLQDSLKFTHLHRASVLLGIDFLMNLQNKSGRPGVLEHQTQRHLQQWFSPCWVTKTPKRRDCSQSWKLFRVCYFSEGVSSTRRYECVTASQQQVSIHHPVKAIETDYSSILQQ